MIDAAVYKNKKFLLAGLLLSTALISPKLALSDTTWTGGGGDNNWSTSANWSDGVPDIDDVVSIPSTSTIILTEDSYANSIAVSGIMSNDIDQVGAYPIC